MSGEVDVRRARRRRRRRAPDVRSKVLCVRRKDGAMYAFVIMFSCAFGAVEIARRDASLSHVETVSGRSGPSTRRTPSRALRKTLKSGKKEGVMFPPRDNDAFAQIRAKGAAEPAYYGVTRFRRTSPKTVAKDRQISSSSTVSYPQSSSSSYASSSASGSSPLEAFSRCFF